MKNNSKHQHGERRASFTTRIGAVATTAGAAVGLGNVWRFPYEAGAHGGGAFMLCYLLFIIVLGVPVICSEFIMGRASRSNELGAFRKFSNSKAWTVPAYLGLLSSVMILSFYSVVAGWTVEYFFKSMTGALQLESQVEYKTTFAEFTSGNLRPLFWTLSFLLINAYVLLRGVAKGIEKISNVLMPILFLLLVVFCINSLTLSGAREGLAFLLYPDFSAVTPRVVLGALGQAFFSLSIGLGCMMTYASYFTPSTRLGRTAVTTAGLDTLVALLSGIIIFPAVFTFGVSPEGGPTLVFEVLPSIFHKLPLGAVWSTLFFFLLMLASITSTISMSEINISYLVEERGMKRRSATWLSTAVAIVFGTLCCLSFGCLDGVKVCGMTFFDIFNNVSSDLLLPIGGMLTSIFVGWFLPREVIERQLTGNGAYRFRFTRLIVFSLRYVAPTGIALVLLNSIGLL